MNKTESDSYIGNEVRKHFKTQQIPRIITGGKMEPLMISHWNVMTICQEK